MAWRRPQETADSRQGVTVLADWTGDLWTYPARVAGIEQGKMLIEYLDGDKEWLPPERVYRMDLAPGDIVYIPGEYEMDRIGCRRPDHYRLIVDTPSRHSE